MRDLFFVGFLAAFFAAGFRRPFLFVLAYVYIDIVSPQRLTYLLLNAVPISLVAVALAVGGFLLADDKRDVRVAPRQWLIVLLLLYCGATTRAADFPVEALDKWGWVWKTLAFAAFLPLTLRTRLRIEALLLVMIASASSIIIVGGLKTIASGGGGYGTLNLMVANNSGLYEGSTISTVAVAIIPLILWFTRHGTVFPPDWKVTAFCYALVFACVLIPVGTSTRTGLLCIGLVAALMLRDARRKLLYLGLIAAAGMIAVPFLPSAFTERMGTIKTYKGDESASTRLAVWGWTWDYAKQHPLGGGFEMYRQNQIRYDTEKVEGDGNNATVDRKLTVDKARAFHSAYFEMIGEQGFPGLVIWALINLIGLFRMEVLRHRYRSTEPDRAWISPLASALQSAHIVYLLGAAFIAIAFQPFVYMLIGAQIGLDTYLGRKRAVQLFRPLRKQRTRVTRDGMTTRYELRALTGMRGIAAWFVVLYHIRLSIAGLPPFGMALLAKGYLAVDFFFLLSGFVIWLSWNDRLRDGGLAAVPRFLWRRLARIWPLHLFMLGCATALALVQTVAGRHDAVEYPFGDLPLQLLLLQNWGFTDHLAWNPPSWSISTEWAAYLLFPALSMYVDWRRMRSIAVIAVIGTLCLILHMTMARVPTLGSDIWVYGLRRCVIEFGIGTALCALYLRFHATPKWPSLVATSVAAGAVGSWCLGAPETLVVPAGFAAALLALALTSVRVGNPLATPLLRYLGEISYATYLGHYLLFVVFKLAFVRDQHDVSLLLIGLYLILVLASSIALHHWVEQPAQRRMNRLATYWRAGSGRQASAVSS